MLCDRPQPDGENRHFAGFFVPVDPLSACVRISCPQFYYDQHYMLWILSDPTLSTQSTVFSTGGEKAYKTRNFFVASLRKKSCTMEHYRFRAH